MTDAPNPARILEVGLGFTKSKVLQTAIDHGVFTLLGERAMTGEEIRSALGWHPRGVHDLLDGLVAMRFLTREGSGASGRYRNTPETATFLDKNQPDYVGGILEMASARLYPFWGSLGEAMRTGRAQNETKDGGESIFTELYQDPVKLRQFMDAMTGFSRGNFRMLATTFDFSRYQTLLDVGGASGLLSTCVAEANPHLRCTSFDLPAVEPVAREAIAAAGLSDRVKTASGDFFKDPLPKADVVTMGMILHDWNLERKMMLIRAAHDALPKGGAFIAVEAIIDDERRENVLGLMMSLNMLIEFGDAFDFTGADFTRWCSEVGFARTEILPLAGPSSAAIAYK